MSAWQGYLGTALFGEIFKRRGMTAKPEIQIREKNSSPLLA